MIIDHISNLSTYAPLVKGLTGFLALLQEQPSLSLGRHEFDGGFVLVTEGNSTPILDKDFESHVNYVDVMLMLEGSETLSYCPAAKLTTVKAYNPEEDCMLSKSTMEKEDVVIRVPEGDFYIMLPKEGHKPCIHVDAPYHYKKYIIKCKQ